MNFQLRLLSLALGVFITQPVLALTNNLALTPPMGWNDWNSYHCGISEGDVTNTAAVLVANGMKAAGYQFVNIDDGWGSTRDSNGVIQAYSISGKFPHGIKWLADYVHSQGLKLGLYTDHGTNTCSSCVSGQTPPKQAGSYGYEYVDAFTYASWGADYLKDDSCNLPAGDIPYDDYFRMADGLMKSGRDITFSLCPNAAHYEYWSPDVGNLWRTTGDIGNTFASMISKIDQNSRSAYLAGPGRWNDADMLEVGNGEFATNLVAAQTHFTMWCIMAAPLLAGNNVSTMSADTLAILTNVEAIAVDQDPAGGQGEFVGGVKDSAEVWSKPLGYDFTTRAVVLLNRSTTSSATITCNWTNLLFQPDTPATVRDLWAHSDLGTFTNSFTATIPPYGSMLLKIVGTPVSPPGSGTNYLSDLQPVYAYTGWGTQTKDKSIAGNTLTLNGVAYSKGIGTHAIGGQEYNLGGVCSHFHAVIGVDDEVGVGNGSVIFQVLADGRKIYDSGIMICGDTPKTVDLDMTGVRRLTIGVTDTGNDATGNRNSYDHSDWADAFIVVTNTTPQVPETPTGLMASPGNAIALTWNNTLAAISYNVKRSTANGGGYTNIANVPVATYTDTNVVGGVTYYYVVSAVSSLGEGSDSEQVSAAPCNVPPAPTNVTTSVSNTTVVVSWNASPGATSYVVSRFTGDTPPVALANVATTNYTDTNVVIGKIYYYLVSAANDCNQSAYSSFAAANPSAPPPVYATSYWTNTNTGFPQSWNLNANWTNSAVFPSAPGSAAMIAAGIAADQTIALNQNITIGALLIGDPDGSSRYAITATGGSLTFDGGGNNATLTQMASSRGDVIAAPIVLAANLDVVNGSTNPLVIAGAVSNSSASLNLVGGTLQIGDGTTNGSLGSVGVTNNGALVFNRSDSMVISGTISGTGSLAQNGTGILTVSGANSYSGGTTIESGTLQLDNNSALGPTNGGAVTITNGGTLDIGGPDYGNQGVVLGLKQINVSGWGVNSNGAIVNNSSTWQYANNNLVLITLQGDTAIGGAGRATPGNGNTGGRWDLRGTTTEPAVLSTGGHPYNLIKRGGNQIVFVNAIVDTNLANIDVKQGFFEVQGTTMLGNSTNNLTVEAGATFGMFQAVGVLGKNFILNGNGQTYTVFSEGGANSIAGPVTLNSGGCVFGCASGKNLTLSNSVGGAGSLLVSNASASTTVYLSGGDNTYSGATAVMAGTLALTGNSSIADSSIIMVNSGATLDASGRSDATLTLAAGQTLTGDGSLNGKVVASNGATIVPGMLTFSTNLTLNGGSTTVIGLTNHAAQVSGTLTCGGTLIITNFSSNALSAGDRFQIFNASNYSGAFINLVPPTPGSGLAWDTSSLTNGVLGVVTAPPPRIGSAGLAGGSMVIAGGGGSPHAAYYVLVSTNLALPLGWWTPIATNFFDDNGNFNFTNEMNSGREQLFYRLELP